MDFKLLTMIARKISIIALLLCFPVFDAFAYLDPGTGGMFIQMLIGALVGVGITLKIYWYKIKLKLFKS